MATFSESGILPTDRTVVAILGGGRGTRLWPLTEQRSKPAVPLGGRYRLIDIPISNCINSGFRRMFVLTQFNSASLNRHVNLTYKFDYFTRGFVEILAAEQRADCEVWFQGTADAVRRSFRHFKPYKPKYLMILSGDQLYKMDYRKLLKFHIETGAAATVSCVACDRESAKSFGLMNLDDSFSIADFAEKPKEDEVLDRFRATTEVKQRFGIDENRDCYLASMGIYIFDVDKLTDLLADESRSDFGKHVLPDAVAGGLPVKGYVFDGYWEDIGTIRSFFDANLMMAEKLPPFDIYTPSSPIYTNPRYLPSTKIYSCRVASSLVADGCIMEQADLDNCVIGQRSVVNAGVTMKEVVMMGADGYEQIEDFGKNERMGIPNIGIGAHSVIEQCIIDKNARIGKNVKIINKDHVDSSESQDWAIREGIVIIKKNVIIPDGTVI